MPESPPITNEWYLNSHRCIIYWQFLSSPSGAALPWHLTNSYGAGGRADTSSGARPGPQGHAEGEMNDAAHTWRFHLSRCFYCVSAECTHRHDQALRHPTHAHVCRAIGSRGRGLGEKHFAGSYSDPGESHRSSVDEKHRVSVLWERFAWICAWSLINSAFGDEAVGIRFCLRAMKSADADTEKRARSCHLAHRQFSRSVRLANWMLFVIAFKKEIFTLTIWNDKLWNFHLRFSFLDYIEPFTFIFGTIHHVLVVYNSIYLWNC